MSDDLYWDVESQSFQQERDKRLRADMMKIQQRIDGIEAERDQARKEADALRRKLDELQATHDALLNVSAAGVRSLDAKIEELRRKLDGAQAVMEEVAKLDPAEIANFGIVRMARAWLIAGTPKENAPDE